MRIIPVLDLKGGLVVRAKMGERDRYAPIVTPLAKSADPVAVASGLRHLHPFQTFYCADLDAIMGRSPNTAALADLRSMKAAPELWVDAGIANVEQLKAALSEPDIYPVLGSESQPDDTLVQRFKAHPRLILSLDFFADGFRGPESILRDSVLWPQTIIIMTLAKVGSAAGPDYERLADIKAKAGNRSMVAAGGIRNEADIRSLAAMGITAALVATSLHDGTLTSAQLAALGQD